jgi:phenylacetate-CoA ligase
MRARDGLACAAALASALSSQWRSAAWHRRRQRQALLRQLRFAAAHVPFYRRLVAERRIDIAALRDGDTLPALPVLRRDDIQREPDAFLSQAGDRQAWRESHTSGSLGRPLVTWFDPGCWAQVKYALKARWLLNAGFRPGSRVAIVDDVPAAQLEAHARRFALPAERRVGGRRYLSVFEPPERHLPAYRAFRPHFIYCFPSYFAALAAHWDEAMRAHVPLRALLTSGESLPPALRARLEAVFGAPVLDAYGSTEFKDIAWQCPDGEGYHVNMESVAVEIVDDDGCSVSPGAAGEVVVTSLTNRAMPLLRYGTEDRAIRLDGPCRCGRGLERLAAVEGRRVDYLPIPELGLVSPYELTTGLSTNPEIAQFKIVQQADRSLEVLVVLRPGANGESLQAVRAVVEVCVRHRVPVAVRAVASIPRDASGKHRAIELRARAESP